MDSLQLTRVNGKLNTAYDDFAGGGNASPGLAPGQLGLITTITKEHALQLSNTDVGTLYEGEYQYVKLGTTPTVDGDLVIPVKGMALFWEDRANFVVNTNDELRSELAGVFLCNALPLDENGDPVDPTGKYIYMQKVGPGVYGRATVLGLEASTFAEDEPVIAAGDGTSTFDRTTVEDPFTAFTAGLAEGAADPTTFLVVVRMLG
jgi:hypothetical protein